MQGVIMNNKIVEVGFLLTKSLNYYHNLIINAGGINTYNCETHDIYWTDKNLDGLSENQMKKSCVRFRRSRGLNGSHFEGNDNWKSEFQNYNVYNKNHEDKFPCNYEEIEKFEIEFNKNNIIRVFDTHKFDYQYMIGNMKSRIQIQQIDDIGLVLYYDNPDYYDLNLEKQREAIIRELNIYGFYFKFDQLGIDKLRSLYYKESRFSSNQNA